MGVLINHKSIIVELARLFPYKVVIVYILKLVVELCSVNFRL